MANDNISFDGRVAIVTGAGAGLGRLYAIDLAKRGAKVVVNDLGGSVDGTEEGSSRPADKVVDEIQALGGEAVANYNSVDFPEGGENIVKTAVDAFGKVDILVNNAGILRDKSFLKMEPDNWDAVVSVHLKGGYCVTRPAFKEMKANNFGRIIMTTSAAGLYGNFGQINYSSAKLGLVGFMNTLKLEGAKYNINVNTIAPIAATRLTEGAMPPEMTEKVKPEFVVPMVTYLCSDKCSETGNIYNAAMGLFSRVAIVTGSPVLAGNGQNPPTAEEVLAKIDIINSLDNAKPYPSAGDQFFDYMKIAEDLINGIKQ